MADWVEKMIEEKKTAAATSAANEEFLEAGITGFFKDLSDQVEEIVKRFNSNQMIAKTDQLKFTKIPSNRFMVEKRTFPQGVADVKLDKEEKKIRCTYRFIRAQREKPINKKKEFDISSTNSQISAFETPSPVQVFDLPKAVLSDFFDQII